ncbi:hypothetical protein GCM10028805_47370 [Spirosoma harenae]
MLTLAILLIGLITLLAFQLPAEPSPDFNYEARPFDYPATYAYGIVGLTKRFLSAFVRSLLLLFGRLTSDIQVRSQICLLHIRQALSTMHFGRGLLHS